MKFILTPIDFSGATPRVLDAAAKFAGDLRAHVVLLHVLVAPRSSSMRADSGSQVNTTKALREAAERRLMEAKAELLQRGIPAHALCLTGRPAADIADQAIKLNAECIVMGSHGHGALHELVVGSTVSAVLKRAPCPVMIVPVRESRDRGLPALARRVSHTLRR